MYPQYGQNRKTARFIWSGTWADELLPEEKRGHMEFLKEAFHCF